MAIPCMPLKGLWDGPLFGREPGTLSALQNMEIRKEGYAEARGGMEELKPSGGTPADAISEGGYSDAFQVTSNYGWVRTYDAAAGAGSQYSKNLQFDPGGWLPWATGVANDALYFGADSPFSRVGVILIVSGIATSFTSVYEYWDGSNWTALTTAETIDWQAGAISVPQHASWTLPTSPAWTAKTDGDSGTGNVLKYWMRIRLTAVNTLSVLPRVMLAYANWVGMRELYEASQSPKTSATAGTLKRHGQTGTTEEWFAVTSSAFSGSASPSRLAGYRGRLYMVNGKEQKRWDGANYSNLGIPKFAASAVAASAAGSGISPGFYRYYVAWGYGPITVNPPTGVDATRFDYQPLYGVGEALSAGDVNSGGLHDATVTITGTMPADASMALIYRTQDMTAVPTENKGDFPAFLVGVLLRDGTGTNPVNDLTFGGVFTDSFASPLFPNNEAIVFDNRPPERCKFITVYQNRLLLGDDNFWYWSDAFKTDVFNRFFNFISLARASGGRHMGGVEFADQVVLFTEDQTWGLTSIDLDVPQLYPIHPGVGCVAPDAIAVGDGVLIWPAKDGFYMWDGTGLPKRISDSMEQAFGSMSFESHGGSKATLHNGRYDIRISNPDYTTIGSAYRFSLEAFSAGRHPWNTILHAGFASTLFPLATVHAPLGNNDAGKVHPLWGKVDYSTAAGEYGLFLGELTTQDAGSNYSCVATMHYPVGPRDVYTPSRVMAYYQAADGWGTPAFAFTPATNIGSSVGTINTGTPDTGADYSIIGGTFSEVGRGSSDLQVSFTVSSAVSGTVGQQRLFGSVLEGQVNRIRRGMV